ncbi:hypothetical protein EBZ39_00615 [bacterium]|nr:hypothetical protein [bacterium]
MTHNAVGGAAIDHPLLNYDWHRNLQPAQLAAYIRYQYIWQKDNAVDWDSPAHTRRRPNWDGGKDLYGVKHTSTWGEIVKRVSDHVADPGMWVHAHFSTAANMRLQLNPANASLPEIRPSMLHSKMSAQIYDKYLSFMPEVIWSQYEIAGNTIESRFRTSASIGLTPDEQQLYVLCDESYVTATPFFRHAFAAAGGCVDAVEQYLWVAALDYEVHQRVYDSVVANNQKESWWVTDDLRAAVVQIRQHWENYNG